MAEIAISIEELDKLIEEALSEEPFLKAPLSLQRGVEARVTRESRKRKRKQRIN